MQPHGDLVGADRLDRVANLDLAPVQVRTACGLNSRRDVRRRDRAEQPAARTRAGLQADLQAGKLLGGGLRVVDTADLACLASPLDQVDLLLGAPAPAHGQAAGHQVVSSVPAGNIDYVAGGTQARDLLGEDELHGRTAHRYLASLGLSVPCSCTAAAPSRGRS